VKVKKVFTLNNDEGTSIINTEYLDSFQYSTPNTEPIRRAIEAQDDTTINVATAGEEEAFLPSDRLVVDPGGPVIDDMILSFFPTAEGYYDYENFRYIYQYRDHLGNVRVSYVRDTNNALKIMDTNEYYPFGMSFLKPTVRTVYDPMAIPYNYKYSSQELQETGFYDFGFRQYMPDIGRWMTIDPLAEQYRRWSPFNYAMNNPMRFIDPDGRGTEDWVKKDNKWTYDANIKTAEQAKAAGADDFAKNGTVLSNANINGGETGYVRLNEGGTADYLPNDGGQNQATNAAVAFSGAVGSALDAVANFFTNNTGDTFYINPGGANDNVGYSGFRPGKDNVVNNEGYLGGLLGGGGLGSKLDLKMSQSDGIIGAMNSIALFLGINPSSGGAKNDSVTIREKYYKKDGTLNDTISTVPSGDSARTSKGIDSMSSSNATEWLKKVKWIK
jgi:RHS repeat-associated protein